VVLHVALDELDGELAWVVHFVVVADGELNLVEEADEVADLLADLPLDIEAEGVVDLGVHVVDPVEEAGARRCGAVETHDDKFHVHKGVLDVAIRVFAGCGVLGGEVFLTYLSSRMTADGIWL
jgi:hypothetical protein